MGELPDGAAARFAEAYGEANIRELPGIKASRDAFTALGDAFPPELPAFHGGLHHGQAGGGPGRPG